MFDVWSHGSWSLLETGSVYLSSVDVARVSWKACRTRQVTVSLVPPALLQMRQSEGKGAAGIISVSGDAFIPHSYPAGLGLVSCEGKQEV